MILGILVLSAQLAAADYDKAAESSFDDERRISPFSKSLRSYDGLWIKDPADAHGDCLYAVRVDAGPGHVLRVLACKDGRTQLERQEVIRVALDADSSWSPGVGFLIETKAITHSCPEPVLASGFTYAFDLSLSSGGSEESLFMSSAVGTIETYFRSAATYPELGKNKNCSRIVQRARQEFHKDNEALQTAALACAAQIETSACVVPAMIPEVQL